jgi:outer membrane protein assembly factor BamB
MISTGRVLAALLTCLVSAAVPVTTCLRAAEPPDLATRPGEDWAEFLGPSGNGRSSLARITAPWPAGGPPVIWHCELGEGYCAPAVARGRCLVFDRVGRDVRLRCLHAETGKKLWEERYPSDYADMFGYDGGPRAAPVIAGDAVITFGPEGRLVCRAIVDGAVRWQIDTATAFHVVQNFFGVGAAPLVVDVAGGPVVIAQVGGSKPGSAPPAPERLDLVRGLDSGLVAFDLATGRERWRSSAELASYSAPIAAPIAGRQQVLAWMRDRLIVVDPATGGLRGDFAWRADDVFSAVAASPVVAGNEILLSEAYSPGSVLLDASGPQIRSLRQDRPNSRPDKALKSHWATPVLHEGHVYGQSGRNSGDSVLVCIDWQTGGVRWSEPGLGRASLALVAEHLLVLGEYGDLLLAKASPERFTEISRTRLIDREHDPQGRGPGLLAPPCWAAPVIARGYGYLRGQGRLVCIDLVGSP